MRQRDNFEIRGPDNVVFGRGTVGSIGERAAALGDSVLVVTDAEIRRLGLLDDVLEAFDEQSRAVAVFDDVTPEPTADVVRAGAARASEHDVDVVVGVGGGSPMDVAKAVALLARSEQPLENLYGRDLVEDAGLPSILVPTTSGTGSEVSPAIVLYDEGEKRVVISDEAFADTALVDPALTMHLPLELTRATGLDAFSHAIGSYVSTTSNAYADALTVEAMELIETHLRDATFHGADAPLAREQMSLAAMLAMLGRVNGGKAAIHSFAYGLQEMYDLPHGEAIAMVLPEVVEYNLPAAVEQLARLGTRIYDADGTDRERAQAVVDGLYRLRSDVGLDRSLGSVGSRDDLNRLAEYALHSERHLRENPRDVTERDARTLLERLF